MQTVNDETLDDEKKLEIFNKSFKIMSDITIDLVAESISAIRIPNGVVSDKKFIREFIENSDSSMVQKIQSHIESIKETSGIQPMLVQSSAEHIEMGAPESYLLPIRMDNSDFFGRGS
jgi:ABC-type antimicrobial peptide transport system permease subunit